MLRPDGSGLPEFPVQQGPGVHPKLRGRGPLAEAQV